MINVQGFVALCKFSSFGYPSVWCARAECSTRYKGLRGLGFCVSRACLYFPFKGQYLCISQLLLRLCYHIFEHVFHTSHWPPCRWATHTIVYSFTFTRTCSFDICIKYRHVVFVYWQIVDDCYFCTCCVGTGF